MENGRFCLVRFFTHVDFEGGGGEEEGNSGRREFQVFVRSL